MICMPMGNPFLENSTARCPQQLFTVKICNLLLTQALANAGRNTFGIRLSDSPGYDVRYIYQSFTSTISKLFSPVFLAPDLALAGMLTPAI